MIKTPSVVLFGHPDFGGSDERSQLKRLVNQSSFPNLPLNQILWRLSNLTDDVTQVPAFLRNWLLNLRSQRRPGLINILRSTITLSRGRPGEK